MRASYPESKAIKTIGCACVYPYRMAASDSNAILPVRIGTAIAILATAIAGFTGPISPGELVGGSTGPQVWWFGAGICASLMGIVGLVFLRRRARQREINSS